MTERDGAMLAWLSVVRIADMSALRFALAGQAGASAPVSERRVRQWVARLIDMGLLERERVSLKGDSIVWVARRWNGVKRPQLLGQMTRHELTVAAVSARYLTYGFSWERDRKPFSLFEHQTDGVARRGEEVDFVVVELTAKTPARYQLIFQSHTFRLRESETARVVYLCSPEAARTVRREAARWMPVEVLPRLVVLEVIDVRGRIAMEPDQLWTDSEAADLLHLQEGDSIEA
ncbi:MAG: hypothetical protein V4531_12200 [Actinomycetota bacterium]